MLSLDEDDEALRKGKASFVIVANGQNALKKEKKKKGGLVLKNDSLSQISSVGRALKRNNRVIFHFFFPSPNKNVF